MSEISVIVPVYKVEPYIRRCIDSILSQTFTDFELILVDDGSPDNCPAICNEYALRDERIHVIHQENGGLSAARNAGIDYVFTSSNSEWISFVDSDDWIDKHYLEYLYRGACSSNVGISSCSYTVVSDVQNNQIKSSDLQYALCTPEAYYVNNRVNAIVAWGKLYNKTLFYSLRYPVGRINEDEFLTYRLLFSEAKIAVIDNGLYMYYQNPNGIMNSKWSPKRLDVLDAFEEQKQFFYDNGFFLAYNQCLKSYIGALVANVIELQNNNKERKTITKKLRRLLITKSYLLKDEKYRLWYYDVAFPKLMNVYWIIKNKIDNITQ